MSSILSWIVWARSRKPSGLAPSSKPSAFSSLDSLLLVLRSTTQVEFERDIGQTLGRRFEDMGLGTGTCWNLLEPSQQSLALTLFFYPLWCGQVWIRTLMALLRLGKIGCCKVIAKHGGNSQFSVRLSYVLLICSSDQFSYMFFSCMFFSWMFSWCFVQHAKDIQEFVDWALSLRSRALILAVEMVVGMKIYMSKLVWFCLFGLDL